MDAKEIVLCRDCEKHYLWHQNIDMCGYATINCETGEGNIKIEPCYIKNFSGNCRDYSSREGER